jgi:hypothetical protein
LSKLPSQQILTAMNLLAIAMDSRLLWLVSMENARTPKNVLTYLRKSMEGNLLTEVTVAAVAAVAATA